MKIENFDLKIDHHNYRVEFRIGQDMRFNGRGKNFPTVTQCAIYADGFLAVNSEVVKCDCDKHNEHFAKTIALKKAFKKRPFWKELRNRFWLLIGHP